MNETIIAPTAAPKAISPCLQAVQCAETLYVSALVDVDAIAVPVC
ncbi:hypothetical protein [Pseudomonas putida]